MTKTEAIETIRANYPPENYTQLREALDMAISAIRLDYQEAEARVMTLAEIEESKNCIVWFEDEYFDRNTPYNYALVEAFDLKNHWVWFRIFADTSCQQRRDYESYGKRWQCWTKQPTKEQRKAVKS